MKGSLGLYAARVISFFCATFATWAFNRTITFGAEKSGHSKKREFSIYLFLMLIGGSVNYLTYALLVSTQEFIASNPVIGVAAGSIAGMFINLATSKIFLFKNAESKIHGDDFDQAE